MILFREICGATSTCVCVCILDVVYISRALLSTSYNFARRWRIGGGICEMTRWGFVFAGGFETVGDKRGGLTGSRVVGCGISGHAPR